MVTEEKSCILVLHGPNLNLLGKREPEIYGELTLEDINRLIAEKAAGLGLAVDFEQTNHEGVIVDRIQHSVGRYSCIILNAAAYTHYSIAIRDAIAAVTVPVIEVHLSNIYKREEFRHHSIISAVTYGQISGFGADSYFLALEGAARMIHGGK